MNGLPSNSLFKVKEETVPGPRGSELVIKNAGILYMNSRSFNKRELMLSTIDHDKAFKDETAHRYANEVYGPIIPLLLQLRGEMVYSMDTQERSIRCTEMFDDILEYCSAD